MAASLDASEEYCGVFMPQCDIETFKHFDQPDIAIEQLHAAFKAVCRPGNTRKTRTVPSRDSMIDELYCTMYDRVFQKMGADAKLSDSASAAQRKLEQRAAFIAAVRDFKQRMPDDLTQADIELMASHIEQARSGGPKRPRRIDGVDSLTEIAEPERFELNGVIAKQALDADRAIAAMEAEKQALAQALDDAKARLEESERSKQEALQAGCKTMRETFEALLASDERVTAAKAMEQAVDESIGGVFQAAEEAVQGMAARAGPSGPPRRQPETEHDARLARLLKGNQAMAQAHGINVAKMDKRVLQATIEADKKANDMLTQSELLDRDAQASARIRRYDQFVSCDTMMYPGVSAHYDNEDIADLVKQFIIDDSDDD